MEICERGQEKLAELRKAARIAGTEQDAYRVVKKVAQIVLGVPVKELGPEAVEAFRNYHERQRRAYLWSGKIQQVDAMIDGDPDGRILEAVDWVYSDSNGNRIKQSGRSSGFEGNF